MLFTAFLPRPISRASLQVVHFKFVRTYTVPANPQAPKKKVWDSIDAAVRAVKSGDVLLSGGKPLSLVSTSTVRY